MPVWNQFLQPITLDDFFLKTDLQTDRQTRLDIDASSRSIKIEIYSTLVYSNPRWGFKATENYCPRIAIELRTNSKGKSYGANNLRK